jgi:hypothetical protein
VNFYAPPPVITAEVFATVPARLSKSGYPSTWVDANHPGSKLGSFLEGPAFDRAGNLYVVDIPCGRILRFAPDGACDVIAEDEGWPNGLAIHRDGSTHTGCPWKATASYYAVVVNGETNKDAAWYCPETTSAAWQHQGLHRVLERHKGRISSTCRRRAGGGGCSYLAGLRGNRASAGPILRRLWVIDSEFRSRHTVIWICHPQLLKLHFRQLRRSRPPIVERR